MAHSDFLVNFDVKQCQTISSLFFCTSALNIFSDDFKTGELHDGTTTRETDSEEEEEPTQRKRHKRHDSDFTSQFESDSDAESEESRLGI